MSIEKAYWTNYEPELGESETDSPALAGSNSEPAKHRWIVFYVKGARIGSAEQNNANLEYMRARYHTRETVTSTGLDVDLIAPRKGAPRIDA